MRGDYEIREGFYYNHYHGWVKIKGDLAFVGLTDYAQEMFGEVVYVDLPEVGKQVVKVAEPKTGDMELGSVESVKTVSTLYSPLSGTVAETNAGVQIYPALINVSPYDDGWMCSIRPSALAVELKSLMGPEEYRAYLNRLR